MQAYSNYQNSSPRTYWKDGIGIFQNTNQKGDIQGKNISMDKTTWNGNLQFDRGNFINSEINDPEGTMVVRKAFASNNCTFNVKRIETSTSSVHSVATKLNELIMDAPPQARPTGTINVDVKGCTVITNGGSNAPVTIGVGQIGGGRSSSSEEQTVILTNGCNYGSVNFTGKPGKVYVDSSSYLGKTNGQIIKV